MHNINLSCKHLNFLTRNGLNMFILALTVKNSYLIHILLKICKFLWKILL